MEAVVPPLYEWDDDTHQRYPTGHDEVIGVMIKTLSCQLPWAIFILRHNVSFPYLGRQTNTTSIHLFIS